MATGDERFQADEQFLRDLYNVKYLFSDKWAPAINVTLTHGPMRRSEILSTIESYSLGEEWSGKPVVLHDSILTRTLRKMTEQGLLVRQRDTSTFPPKVFYSLTPQVAEFMRILEPLAEWVRRNPELVERAQAHGRHHGDDGEADTDTSSLDDDLSQKRRKECNRRSSFVRFA
ncbi:winged helix-turn-helix transcriptional regulator [Kibdelosporangium philippinense]|uniref:Winged helix-turn-helix transcriptional regulator n=1 Tax=Kibdelosporangium philippinense TaxID=211113 RepID=A0ABS8ZRT0_9PSEU|nr:winged helix-turn-helix transcriptional regulator [Kibdelosporangium philippinense]MCE7009928.1 winged helix-turn-helix transcriptional regulator [Kibdelosporangium philippinense]